MQVDIDQDGCCTIADGDERLIIDLGKDYGGRGTTPSPGFFVRASLGACLAQAYLAYAAYHDVPVNSLSVELQTDYDMRGNLGIDDRVPRSYTAVRYIVEVDSPAPREKVEEIIDEADAVDWVRDVFAREIPLSRELRITGSDTGRATA